MRGTKKAEAPLRQIKLQSPVRLELGDSANSIVISFGPGCAETQRPKPDCCRIPILFSVKLEVSYNRLLPILQGKLTF
jgi:hypothetical protein